MKNFLLIILMAVICISASVVSTTTFKPATPKSTIVFTDNSDRTVKRMLTYSKKGYITKVVSYTNNDWAIVVMEKY